jgi:peptide/nickel transport system substrate-binding protein
MGRGTVIRYIRLQAVLALLGIVLLVSLLGYLALTLSTVEVPQVGGMYVEGVAGSPQMINPVLSELNALDQDVVALVFEGLTDLAPDGDVVPALATDWEISADGRIYTFRLREDVVWHDGAPFTAADVLFTFQALQDPDYQGSPQIGELWRSVSIDLLDDYTVRFTLQEPFAPFLRYTIQGLLPAHLLGDVPAAELARSDFSTQHPVGTGIFQVQDITSRRVVLTANPRYWGAQPYLERIEFRAYSDQETVLAAYQRGEVMGVGQVAPSEIARLASLPDVRFHSARLAEYSMVMLNLNLPIFQQVEVRQALLYGLDRQGLINQELNGQGLVAHSPILPDTWASNPDVRRYDYQPDLARQMLAQAGWQDQDGDGVREKDGAPLAFTLLARDAPGWVPLANELQRQWGELGVAVTVRGVGGDLVPNYLRPRSFDAVLISVVPPPDPDPYPLWHSTQADHDGQNYTGFTDPAADLVLEEARAVADGFRRAELYRAFQDIFAEELPALLLYYPVYTYAVDAQVQGVQLPPLRDPGDRLDNVHDWYVLTRRVIISEAGMFDNSGD